MGISRENRNKKSSLFFTTRRNAGGTGLGLEIAASLLKTYRAEIELDECPQGILFWLRLPARRVEGHCWPNRLCFMHSTSDRCRSNAIVLIDITPATA